MGVSSWECRLCIIDIHGQLHFDAKGCICNAIVFCKCEWCNFYHVCDTVKYFSIVVPKRMQPAAIVASHRLAESCYLSSLDWWSQSFIRSHAWDICMFILTHRCIWSTKAADGMLQHFFCLKMHINYDDHH